jgi:hypothetical protein
MKIPSLTVFAILSAAAATFAAPIAEQAAQPALQGERAAAAPAGQSGGGAAAAPDAIPAVAPFYTLPLGDVAGPRVSFLQNTGVLTAVWMTPQGETYGRGTYEWDPRIKAFTGTSSTVYQCLSDEGRVASTFQYQVKEQLYILSAHQLKDRWTKPMDVDCAVGVVDKFRWYEREWLAADKDWKPLDTDLAARPR